MYRPIPFMEECAAKYGDIFTLKFIGVGSLVFMSAPEMIKQVFTGDNDTRVAGVLNVPRIERPLSFFGVEPNGSPVGRRLLSHPLPGRRAAESNGLFGEVV